MNRTLQKIIITLLPVLIGKLFSSKKNIKVFGFAILIIIGGVWLYSNYISDSQIAVSDVDELSDLQSIYKARKSSVMIYTQGDVIQILENDNKGSRHQRFILSTLDGVSLLIAHNIDLAQSVPLKVGDNIKVYGQYE